MIDASLEFFTKLMSKPKPKRHIKAYEKTSLKVIELVKNGFAIPAKIRTLSASGFPEAFDELLKKADEFANSISEFTGAELIDDKYYRVREASILSFLILTDAMKSLMPDNPINKQTVREYLCLQKYLCLYNSQLLLLNAELKDIQRFAVKVCGVTCIPHDDASRNGLVPLLLMGLSSEIKINLNQEKKRRYTTTGLGLYILNFLKSHNVYTLDKASYRELIENLNYIFDLHKYIIKNVPDLVNESPMSIYSRYYGGDKSYSPALLELDLANFMLGIAYQYNEMTNKISPRFLADFPRLKLNDVLSRLILA